MLFSYYSYITMVSSVSRHSLLPEVVVPPLNHNAVSRRETFPLIFVRTIMNWNNPLCSTGYAGWRMQVRQFARVIYFLPYKMKCQRASIGNYHTGRSILGVGQSGWSWIAFSPDVKGLPTARASRAAPGSQTTRAAITCDLAATH